MLAELARGRKANHWMWFVFPQIAGLGSSPVSRQYAIASLGEARAYLTHSVLGPRLRDCVALLLSAPTHNAEDIFGGIDARKLRSSMTLFHRAAPDEPLFREVLDHFFSGNVDSRTDAMLETMSRSD